MYDSGALVNRGVYSFMELNMRLTMGIDRGNADNDEVCPSNCSIFVIQAKMYAAKVACVMSENYDVRMGYYQSTLTVR